MSEKETKDPFEDPFFPDANVNATAGASATTQQQQQPKDQVCEDKDQVCHWIYNQDEYSKTIKW